MSRMTRSAHGLTLDRDEDWRVHGLCGENPDMWSSTHSESIALARHTCWGHCPVRRQCDAAGEETPRDMRRGMIYGGHRYLDRSGEVDRNEYVMTRSCWRCRDG